MMAKWDQNMYWDLWNKLIDLWIYVILMSVLNMFKFVFSWYWLTVPLEASEKHIPCTILLSDASTELEVVRCVTGTVSIGCNALPV
jgi:hypothetical protein